MKNMIGAEIQGPLSKVEYKEIIVKEAGYIFGGLIHWKAIPA